MSYYLLDHRNPYGDHFYTTRRRKLIAIVVHITAGLEDRDLIGADMSAENVSRYAATTSRRVSWHSGSDSDTWIDLLPYSYTAFQCVDYNSSTAGHEISKRETDWRDDPAEWVRRTLTIAGMGLGRKARENGIPIRKASKTEVDRAIASGGPPVGFISHHELDPDRRTDPGWVWENGRLIDTFPWSRFLGFAGGGSMALTDADKQWLRDLTGAGGGVDIVNEIRQASDRAHKDAPRAALLALTGKSNASYGEADAEAFAPTALTPRLANVEASVTEILEIVRTLKEGPTQ